MSRRRRITIILTSLAVVLVAVLAVLSAVSVTVPGTCELCHRVQAIAPGVGDKTHAGVSCLQCHANAGVADRAELAVAVPLMLIGSAPEGVEQVSPGACLACHRTVEKAITETRGLRINHMSCIPQGTACASCHDEKIHGLQGPGKLQWDRSMGMEECISCHDDENGSQECETCHDGKMKRARLTSGVWQITHGADWERKHGLGGTRMCTACHDGSDCAKCHSIELPHKPDFSRSHGDDKLKFPQSCEDCHSQRFCSDCHGIEMPHPKSFMPVHKTIVESQGDKRCYICHSQRDCRTCHDRHVHPGWARQSSQGAGKAAGGSKLTSGGAQ